MSRLCSLIVMAKAPVPGYAKTRLVPALGAERSALVAQRLLEAAVGHAFEAQVGPVELCCAPDQRHPAFAGLVATREIHLENQCAGDLGARMLDAFERAGRRMAPMLMMGTDAPALDAPMIRSAAKAFDDPDVDAVFVPALDGGYALIGLRRAVPSLFDNMAWSTSSVMAETRARLVLAGLRHVELPPVADIDDAADLIHLPDGWLT
jgi:rSAM/selenodomain-associated transferase 1